ncbi:Fic family protein [Flavihumibacter stibioxidans]|uniref:Cell filamentation protein Fic n=1 Tax=Flavihumibacter stibioxidans TaxID=1834163 RepID=A0ABR7M5Z3_9BACT|nr:Fic family protein [Flavihumibacter stibioxidans]MBC6490397.1 cell filamentation protein Fic [Flavihumibacter stibioxidans]
MDRNRISQIITVFQERTAPEEGYLVGYGALYLAFDLQVPLPDILALISLKHKQYTTEEWRVFTPRYMPEDSFMGHLTFALKYEGINLGLLKKVFGKKTPEDMIQMITEEPTGQYSRRIWFLYEWLMGVQLDVPDLTTGNYVDLVDETIQFASHATEISKRHRIRNNLPGVKDFCPMVMKSPLMKAYLDRDLSQQIKKIIGKIHPDVMARTAAFLLLKDSKASYAIEGERPPQNRAQRWGRAIGQAGQKQISREELIRLQQMVIDNPRFTKMGFREQEGFVGEHDRRNGTPIPDHIAARWKDLTSLMDGLIATNQKMENDKSFDAVLAAAMIAFGFVFIHPFVDGNGRIHRYLIHHVLLRKEYVSKGIIFPVSAIILERLEEYRRVLESFSTPRLDLIEWKAAENNNVEVLNDTIDLYRYFDATKQVEFLYGCVQQTIEKTIPEEVAYLEKYDLMKDYLDNLFEMPDNMVALLVRFLEQGKGMLSNRAKAREFKELTEEEVAAIENKYQEIFQ